MSYFICCAWGNCRGCGFLPLPCAMGRTAPLSGSAGEHAHAAEEPSGLALDQAQPEGAGQATVEQTGRGVPGESEAPCRGGRDSPSNLGLAQDVGLGSGFGPTGGQRRTGAAVTGGAGSWAPNGLRLSSFRGKGEPLPERETGSHVFWVWCPGGDRAESNVIWATSPRKATG